MNARSWVMDQGAIDEVDKLAIEAERRFGVGRLRLLVPLDLRQKFDSQRVKFNVALRAGGVELREEARRMCNAYRALTAEAEKHVERITWWEIVGEAGELITVVRTRDEAARFPADGFKRSVWCLEEIAKLIASHPEIKACKEVFGDAYLEQIKRSIEDPVPAAGDGDLPYEDLDLVNWTGENRSVDASEGF